MPVSVEELKSTAPSIAQATAGQATAGQTSAPSPIQSQDATASYTGTRDAAAASGAASGYGAETISERPGMLAGAQLNKITSQDSANMRRAASQGLLTAGKRGLENSSIAAGAAQGAMVDRATPLALQDAQTNFQLDRANQDATNRASEFGAAETNRMTALNTQLETDVNVSNARAENEINMLNSQLETAVSQGNAEAANRINLRLAELETEVNLNNAQAQTNVNLANADAQTRTSLENANAENQMNAQVLQANAALNEQFMRGEQAIDLATIQGRYQQLISSNETASRLYDSYFNSIGQAMANKDITPDRIAQYVNVQQSMLEAGLRMMDTMNTLDLGAFQLPGATGRAGTGRNNAGSSITPTPASGDAVTASGTPASGTPQTGMAPSPQVTGMPQPGTPEYTAWIQDIMRGGITF